MDNAANKVLNAFAMLDITRDLHGIVEPLIQGSILERWVNPQNPMDTMTAVDAVEKNQVDFYCKQMNFRSGYGLEAIHCLIHLREELNESSPDRTEIEIWIESLVNCL